VDPKSKIASIDLDERTVVRRSADIEHERAVAIFDILEENHFQPNIEQPGPYNLKLAAEENRLIFDICSVEDAPLSRVPLALSGFRRVIKDYFTVCESYYDAIKTSSPSQIEAIDMGRRGLHNEGSAMLQETLSGRIEIDFDTARRLFTLLCVLQIR
jgi:uncharacterized protein (UPF0262 family)